MPNFDGTGPTGKGPMTGRGGGNCVRRKGQANNLQTLENREKVLLKELDNIKTQKASLQK